MRNPSQTYGKALVLVYADSKHPDAVKAFFESSTGRFIRKASHLRWIVVYAGAKATRLEGRFLHLAVEESYRSLPAKTAAMFSFLSRHENRYPRFVKIDASLPGYAQPLEDSVRESIRPDRINFYLGSVLDRSEDYWGFRQLVGTRVDVERWAARKNISLDYSQVFGKANTPPFYWGKYYEVSSRFLGYLGRTAPEYADEHVRLYPAEDVMVARIFSRWLESPEYGDDSCASA